MSKIREDIKSIFKRYDAEMPEERILDDLVFMVRHEKSDSYYEGAMYAHDKIKKSLGVNE